MCPFGGEERKDETRFFDESCPLVHEAKGTLPVQPSTRNPITTDQFSRWRPSLHSPSSSLRQFSDSDCPPRSPNVFLVDLTTPPFSSLPTIPFFHSIRTRINLALKMSNVRFRFLNTSIYDLGNIGKTEIRSEGLVSLFPVEILARRAPTIKH